MRLTLLPSLSLLSPTLLLLLLPHPTVATTSASGPTIETLTPPPASCTRRTQNGDTISVHYRGTLAADGSQFDASYERGSPLVFEVGRGRVIKGWDQGLLEMCIGEKRRLTIPPELGYGERVMGPIPAGSTLVFETELVGIKDVEGRDEL